MWLFILLYGISYCHIITPVDELTPEQAADIEKEFLETHNKLRYKHNTPPLALDADLTKEAEACVATLSTQDSDKPPCATNRGLNIWFSEGGKLANLLNHKDGDPVRDWYEQMYQYPYDELEKTGRNTSTAEMKGAFTQLIWKSTKKLGCAFKASASGNRFVACLYEPKGNKQENATEGQTRLRYQQNVLPKKGTTWEGEADNSLSWWFVFLIFVCVGVVGGWRIYQKRVRRRRKRSRVKPGGIRRLTGAKAGPSGRPAGKLAGAKPTLKPAARRIKKPATRKPATTKPVITKPATTKPVITKPATTTPAATSPAATTPTAAAATAPK